MMTTDQRIWSDTLSTNPLEDVERTLRLELQHLVEQRIDGLVVNNAVDEGTPHVLDSLIDAHVKSWQTRVDVAGDYDFQRAKETLPRMNAELHKQQAELQVRENAPSTAQQNVADLEIGLAEARKLPAPQSVGDFNRDDERVERRIALVRDDIERTTALREELLAKGSRKGARSRTAMDNSMSESRVEVEHVLRILQRTQDTVAEKDKELAAAEEVFLRTPRSNVPGGPQATGTPESVASHHAGVPAGGVS